MSNPTNPEQVCPNDPSHKLSPGTLLCMTCGVPPVPVSKVAAKPKVRMGLDVESSNQLRPDPDKPQGLYASPYRPVKSPAPAPVDQPDEQPRKIGTVFGEDVYMLPAAHKQLMASGVMDNRKDTFDFVGNPDAAAILAREREAARRDAFREVLSATEDMERAYAETGRTVSKGEIKKWLQSELGTGEGRHA